MVSLKDDEKLLKQGMDDDVAKVLGSKNICLREAMLKSLQYGDMGLVEEFKQGSELVGCVETGI